MANVKNKKVLDPNLETIEYKMSNQMAKAILSERSTPAELKMNPHDYLCQTVNELFGLKGYCVKVIRF